MNHKLMKAKNNRIQNILINRSIQNLKENLDDRIYEISIEVAKSAIASSERQRYKPAIVDEGKVLQLFNTSRLFPDLPPKTDEELKAMAAEIYTNLCVPYGTPLYYDKDLRLQVYPKHLLPGTKHDK